MFFAFKIQSICFVRFSTNQHVSSHAHAVCRVTHPKRLVADDLPQPAGERGLRPRSPTTSICTAPAEPSSAFTSLKPADPPSMRRKLMLAIQPLHFLAVHRRLLHHNREDCPTITEVSALAGSLCSYRASAAQSPPLGAAPVVPPGSTGRRSAALREATPPAVSSTPGSRLPTPSGDALPTAPRDRVSNFSLRTSVC